MNWYEITKRYYDGGFWDINKVKQVVVKGKITKAQYKEITGQDYE